MSKVYSKKVLFSKYACRLNKARSLDLDLEFDAEFLYAIGYYGSAYWDCDDINLDEVPEHIIDVTYFGEGYSIVFGIFMSTDYQHHFPDHYSCESEVHMSPDIFKFAGRHQYWREPI